MNYHLRDAKYLWKSFSYLYFGYRIIFMIAILSVEGRLVMEQLNDPLLKMGSYMLEIKFPVKELERGVKTLEKTTEDFNFTCELLTRKIPITRCNLITGDLWSTLSKRKSTGAFMKSFFPNRNRRGFITAVGGMDSDDRKRIDINVDKLRKNEESLKNTITHQTETMDAMYKFVDSSMYNVDNKLKQFMNNFNRIEKMVQDDLNFTSTVENVLYLESELMEIGFKLQTLISNLKEQQHIIIQILLGKTNGVSEIIQLIEPSELLTLLYKAESKMPKGLVFPKNGNSDIFSEILSIIEVSHEPLNNQILLLKLNKPLVSDQKLVAFKGIFIPQVNGTFVVSINIDKDILIKEIEKDWGFVISDAQYKECLSFEKYKICNFHTIEKQLSLENDCLLNLSFRNTTTNCNIRVLNTDHDVWFESEEPNVWQYVTPTEMEIDILHGMNHSHMILRGSGKIRITPGMRIKTNSVKISYTNITLEDKVTIFNNIQYNILNFTLDNWQVKLIPSLDKNTALLSVYDRKKLFDLGVDIEDLKKDRPFLENMIYSPLSTGWSIGGLTTMVIIVVIIYIFWFKRKVSSKDNVQSSVVNIKEVEVVHHIQSQPEVINRNSGINEMFENPNLVEYGEILRDNHQTAIEMEATNSQIESYQEQQRNEDNPNNVHIAEVHAVADETNKLPLHKIKEEHGFKGIFNKLRGSRKFETNRRIIW